MRTQAPVALGVGITLGIFLGFAVILVILGVCVSDSNSRSYNRERERRVARARRRHQQEQEQWRERRLRDVVLLLIERGEAVEGVSLAFQLPNRPEVGARRMLRNRRGSGAERQNLEIQLANEHEDSRLDEEALRISRRPLAELLANGRPVDAEPGPDVMQMLLDGQEIQHHTTTEDDSDFYIDEDVGTATSATPFTNQPGDGEARIFRVGGGTSNGESVPPTPPISLTPARQQQQGDGASSSNATAAESEIDARTAAVLLEEQRLRESREMALLNELRREKRRRHRKPADEIYGEGADYEHNPANDYFLRIKVVQNEATPNSPLWRLLTPFRGNRSRGGRKSAFEGLSPQESGIQQREDTAVTGSSFADGTRKEHSHGGAPF
ncbi:hypothetical protein GH5_01517 [Leishmania sp. Ghana 2012 LV757]|uniref:hypothetical protein n=1 Tax=Leishmania sp. Ghana 2012 LV757 TaxID=2803181 RepID=UPI001B6C9E2F|nr:hypothetical protein GH5_01517 [Leishmania sp. Ghana 2012 LV757]